MYMLGMELHDRFDASFNHTSKLERDTDLAAACPVPIMTTIPVKMNPLFNYTMSSCPAFFPKVADYSFVVIGSFSPLFRAVCTKLL
jgi:hypothetical protein